MMTLSISLFGSAYSYRYRFSVAALAGFYFYGRDRAHKMSRYQANAGKDARAPPSSSEQVNVTLKAKEPMMVFKGGDQGFIPLKLDKVEEINHNTKKFRFTFPEQDSVSELHIACRARKL